MSTDGANRSWRPAALCPFEPANCRKDTFSVVNKGIPATQDAQVENSVATIEYSTSSSNCNPEKGGFEAYRAIDKTTDNWYDLLPVDIRRLP